MRVSVSPSQNFLFSFSFSDVCIQRAALSGGKKKANKFGDCGGTIKRQIRETKQKN
jgi:hypothetical protein